MGQVSNLPVPHENPNLSRINWLTMAVELLPFLATISPLLGAAAVTVVARWNAAWTRASACTSAALTLVLLSAVVWKFDPHRVDERGRAEVSQMVTSFDGLAQSSTARALRTQAQRTAAPVSDAPKLGANANDERVALRGINVRLAFGVDGVILWPAVWIALAVLVALTFPGNTAAESSPAYSIALLIAEAGLLGSLTARDLIVSLVSCEVSLPALYFLIGRWGGADRRTAAERLLIFQHVGCGLTLLGTTLIAVSWPWVRSDFDVRRSPLTFDLWGVVDGLRSMVSRNEVAVEVWSDVAPWAFLLLGLGFALRFPAFPFQRWYTHALEEGSTGVACLLAIGLPQVAFCGWVRFAMPLLREEAIEFSSWLGAIAAVGAIHAGLKAASQSDLKKLAAALSMGQLALALLAMRLPLREGLTGAWLLVQSQGLVTMGLMLFIGFAHSRSARCEIGSIEGLAFDQPKRAVLLVLLLAASGMMACPSGAGALLALSQLTWEATPFAACGIAMWLLLSWSLLVTTQRILFGRESSSTATPLRLGTATRSKDLSADNIEITRDLGLHEFCVTLPLVLLVAWLTLAPQVILQNSEATWSYLLQSKEQRADESE